MPHRLGLLLFALIWLVILAVPETRLLLRVQARGSPFMQPRMQFLPAWLVGRDEFRPRDLAARFPDDPYVLALAAEAVPRANETARSTAQNLDVLIVHFPNEPWLIARRLQRTAMFLNDDRLAKSEINAPTRYPKPDATEVNMALHLAEQGARLEPDNSYFDWYRIWLLLAAHRDREAIEVLHLAARKPRYDSHHREAMRIEMTADRWRPLLTEEIVALSNRVNFPEFAKQRHVARLLVEHGANAENAGDHAQALMIYGDLMRLSARMRKESFTIIELLVAAAMENIARGGGGTPRALTDAEKAQINNQSNNRDRFAQLYTTRFSDYATAHGRADLAREAERESAEASQNRAAASKYINQLTIWGVSTNQYANIAALMIESGLLLPLMLLATAVWCILVVMLRGSDAEVENVPMWLIVLTVVPCCLLGGASGAMGASMWNAAMERSNLEVQIQEFVQLSAVVPPLLMGLLVSVITRKRFRGVFWTQRRPQIPTISSPPEVIRRRQVITLGVLSMCAAGLLTWAVIDADSLGNVTMAAIALLLFSFYPAWLIRWRWFVPDRLPGDVTVEEITDGELRRADRLSPRRAALWGLVWYRQSLGVFVMATSLLYLTLMLGSLPHRRNADARLNQMLRHGEPAVALGKVKL